jgi:hypothetical protein
LPTLPHDWIEHFSAGVAHRLGSCSRDGKPGICRALAADALPDGRVRILVTREAGPDVLDAIRETGQVAAVLALPQTHRTLHLKGRDASVTPAGPDDEPLLVSRREAFLLQVAPYGFTRESLLGNWYAVREGELMRVDFTIHGAWNQSPGPGAGQAIELLP